MDPRGRDASFVTGDIGEFVWLEVAGERLGRIIPRVAAALGAMPDLFAASADGFVLRGDPGESLQTVARRLRSAGLVPGWRDEHCALHATDGREIARFERGAFRTLGLQNRAVHVNGALADGRIWIARRSARKASSPGKLDNLAAGAIAAGESPDDCAVRELWEEAGVPAELAALTVLTGTRIRSLRRLAHGMHDEIIFCADLALPDDFVPACQDGEVAGFQCMTAQEAGAARAAGEFSIEAGLVLGDWLARHGPIG